MNVLRPFVVGLLIGVTALGLAQELHVEKAFGIITSYSTITRYSTWTSTFYSYLYPTTSIKLSTATVTTDHLIQTGPEGPYFVVAGKWNVFVEGMVEFDVTIKNLVDLSIQSGTVLFDVKGLKVHRDDIELTFKSMLPGESLNVKQLIGLPGINVGATVTPLSVRASLAQSGKLVMVTPVETSARTGTVTETYSKTMVNTYLATSAYTVEEPPSAGNTMLILVVAVVAIAAIAGVAFMRIRKSPAKAKPQEAMPQPRVERITKPIVHPVPEAKTDTTPAPTSRPVSEGVKYCVHCGAAIPDVVSFCTKCGKKQ